MKAYWVSSGQSPPLGATAAGLFPLLLPSTIAPVFSLTAAQAATSQHGLRVALTWWTLGISLAVAYAAFLYRSTRGRVRLEDH